MKIYRLFFKRVSDVFFSLLVIAIFLPLFICLYFLVKIDSKGPFFFYQERLGYKGKVFKVFKIRTMTDKKRIVHQEIFKDNVEVTRVGKVLRRLKLDELPQLINILIGDMGIVGPRPGLLSQLPELNEDGVIRLNVRPGLTGLAQVNGNIYLTWEQRWVYDRKYVEELSMLLDLKIVLKTCALLLHGEEKFIKKPEQNG